MEIPIDAYPDDGGTYDRQSLRTEEEVLMAAMKTIWQKIREAFPCECPNCGRDLQPCEDWSKVDEALELALKGGETKEKTTVG